MSIIEKAMQKLNENRDSNGSRKRTTTYKNVVSPANIPHVDKCRVHLDVDTLINAGMTISADGNVTVDNAYRKIKRPILANAFGKESQLVDKGNLVMITSSLPGEGKTYSSLNIAMSIAIEMDRTVLLVDADLPKSTTSKLFGLQKERGLTEVLTGKARLEDVIVSTDLKDFKILPSGKKHEHATELLSSEKMIKVVNELASRYPDRLIIFDSPPLLATSEAQVIAGLAGQVLLVIEADRTLKHLVEEAVGMLDRERAIGVILNKTQQSGGSDYYGSGYGYGYGD